MNGIYFGLPPLTRNEKYEHTISNIEPPHLPLADASGTVRLAPQGRGVVGAVSVPAPKVFDSAGGISVERNSTVTKRPDKMPW